MIQVTVEEVRKLWGSGGSTDPYPEGFLWGDPDRRGLETLGDYGSKQWSWSFDSPLV